VALDGRQSNCERSDRRAHTRRSAQHSEPGGTDVQYIAGERGQERSSATEQYGEQIE